MLVVKKEFLLLWYLCVPYESESSYFVCSRRSKVKIKEVYFLSRTRAGTEMRIKFQLITNNDGKHSHVQAHKRYRR